MKSLALFTKLLSVSVVVYLVPQAADLWESRNQTFPASGIELASTSQQLEPIVFPRRELSGREVNSIASKNLFRRQRSQYVRPVRKVRRVKKQVILEKAPPVIVEKVKPKRVIPPPKLILEGVVMIPGRSIAILGGEYASFKSQKGRVKFLPLKSKRFVLGDLIGEYQITTIDRDQVVLSNLDGDTLKLMLEMD